ncbi:Hsp20/alpha crystallin family protein [Pelotomaculum terephthalicicum JT]|uniref:Hsp20/alpha crystallin family protein n=1 Tax=Pelotomaculum TaxID=191373 RepID=UPI0009CFBF56|nr:MULTISPECIES: Hsp20/alpha crystallin family protein [Pelotomaculum]MCG9968020.1 Hsp20/alpha crystallin family protein [Pelotomaculum terephthalicicum JT]OPX87515.1 MAG: 18 kDa heat shock protein [Pelotomaculum sp. PtaB.Bin117]OPY60627.1 MAG: 18 kDa heat shock protein [Pelotomaculum sp. PtaU1.Bin065]
MALVKWDPFRDLSGLQSSINRLFDDSFRFWREPEAALTQEGAFPVDIKDTPGEFLIKAELPGFNKDNIKVILTDNLLTIRAERQKEEKEENANYLRVERSYGSFSRSFTLNMPVKQDKLRARYHDGVLEITLPKEEDARKKEININIEG